jgi:hypothetical protein
LDVEPEVASRDGRKQKVNMKKTSMNQSKFKFPLTSLALLGLVTAALPASAAMLVDRGLPIANLNNAADANRANVSWAFTQYTPTDYWLVGDTFANTSSQTWAINTIRLWTTGPTDTAVLQGGFDGSTIGVVSSTYSMTAATYADGSTYQLPNGNYTSAMNQLDFAVNILLAPGQTYDFFLDGSGSGDGTVVPFVHASNAALSGYPQDGADNLMLAAEVINGSVDLGNVGPWSSDGYGWDKPSDVNVQVFGTPVPEPTTTMFAGACLLLPFTLRMLRKTRTA